MFGNPGSVHEKPGELRKVTWRQVANKNVVKFKELPHYQNSQLIFWEDVNDCECISFGGCLEMVGGPQHVYFSLLAYCVRYFTYFGYVF